MPPIAHATPDIDIELTEYGSKRLRECLEAGEVDLAALLLPIDEGFDYQPVRNEPLMAVLPISRPLAQRKRIDFTDLADSPFILFEAGFALNAKILAACEREGVQPRVAARSGQSTLSSTWYPPASARPSCRACSRTSANAPASP